MVDPAANIHRQFERVITSVADAPATEKPAEGNSGQDDSVLAEPSNLKDTGALAQLLARAPGAVAPIPDPAKQGPHRPADQVTRRLSIEALLAVLEPGPPDEPGTRPFAAGEICEIHGVFFGCHLLYPGWWTRKISDTVLRRDFWGSGAGVQKVINIRRWLNNGFEQWGPSWNISEPPTTLKPFEDLLMFGQIGYKDETNSLPVVVSAAKTFRLRADMGLNLAIEAKVTGRLFRRDDDIGCLNPAIQRGLERMFAAGHYIPYYIVVDDAKVCRVERVPAAERRVEIYSAYLWQCLVGCEDEPRARDGTVPIDDTLFTWEHTNLLDADTVRFNFESLLFKKKRLESRLGRKLLVLQHSYAVDEFIRESKRIIEPLVASSILSDVLARARNTACSR